MNWSTPRRPRANQQLCYFVFVAALCLLASGLQAHADEGSTLTLDQYLSQVKTGNTGTRGALEASDGEQMRSNEGGLLTAPTAFANAQYTHDGKLPLGSFFNYTFQDTGVFSLGVSKLTDFGLQAKLSSSVVSLSYENASVVPFLANLLPPGSGFSPGGSIATTALEMTQSLASNGFGRSTRATKEQITAQALAESFGNRYAARGTLAQAEGTYWRLVIARQAVELTRENMDRAQKNYDWSEHRVRVQLADQSDALQSQALLESRKLEYQRALDEERAAARDFNTARGSSGADVPEHLVVLTPDSVMGMTAPRRGQYRDDVRAAEQQQLAAQAGARVALERDTPTLDAFGTVAFNGTDPGSLGTAYAQSFSSNHPTFAIGLRFSSPLTIGLANETRAGYTREEAAADLAYQRKVFEQEQSWRDLSERLTDSQRRLKLAVSLEKVQEAKLFHERDRYKTGRSTQFQVLSFETDYALSQLSRIQTQSEVLGILTQMKLYGEAL